MKILLTGANGQLGNEIRKLSSQYNTFEFIYTDVEELDITCDKSCLDLFNNIKPNYLINCAAYTAVDKAETDTATAYKINATAVKNLAEACKVHNTYMIHVSTDYVFDGKSCVPYKETDAVNPNSEYGKSKAEGEKEALLYKNALVIRTSWLYSSFGNNFVKTMIKLGKERDSLNVVSDQIGTPTYAKDLANAILTIVAKTEFVPGIFHYSNEGVCSWYDFACAIMELNNLNCKVNPIETEQYPTPAKRPSYSLLNKNKIKSTYNIEIAHWHESLKEMIEFLNR